jgi:exodeoxyribonuclease VII large subunit
MYFTLKDAKARIRCVLWLSQIPRLSHVPRDGDAVVVGGYVSVYEPQGSYQIHVSVVQPLGAGVLFARFQALKEALERDGLFAVERKRELPRFPERIGVVTSPEGAALRDILQVLARRFPLADVVLAPSVVQGDAAPAQIVAAIEALNTRTRAEVIILGRGGGSLEELWAFNDERVARAVFGSRIPIIAGVGHETDVTIAGLAADLRAPTPSAAAEMAVPDQGALRRHIAQYKQRVASSLNQHFSRQRMTLTQVDNRLARVSPKWVLDRRRQDVDELHGRLRGLTRHLLALHREQLRGTALRLRALNPKAILERGYAVVALRDTGTVVMSTGQVGTGACVDVRVGDGTFGAVVD